MPDQLGQWRMCAIVTEWMNSSNPVVKEKSIYFYSSHSIKYIRFLHIFKDRKCYNILVAAALPGFDHSTVEFLFHEIGLLENDNKQNERGG